MCLFCSSNISKSDTFAPLRQFVLRSLVHGANHLWIQAQARKNQAWILSLKDEFSAESERIRNISAFQQHRHINLTAQPECEN
jgi:hypothetical protein